MASYDYEECSSAETPEHEACYRREHKNGEVTVVTVRAMEDYHVVEAMDFDDDHEFPSEQIAVEPTREKATDAAERWMADNEKGVSPGVLGGLGLGGD